VKKTGGKPENPGRSLPLFSASSGIFRKPFAEKVCAKFIISGGLYQFADLFRFFRKSILGLPDRANPVAIGKLPVTMRSDKQAFCESFEM